jgi:hypothetical protein
VRLAPAARVRPGAAGQGAPRGVRVVGQGLPDSPRFRAEPHK